MDYYTLRKIVRRLRDTVKDARILDVKDDGKLVELKIKGGAIIFSFLPERSGLFFSKKNIVEGETQFSHFIGGIIRNMKIGDLRIEEGDRVVFLDLYRFDPLGRKREVRLIYEILGRFVNLILVEGDVIRFVRREMETDDRVILPGRTYFTPSKIKEKTDLPYLSKDILSEIESRGLDVVRDELYSMDFWECEERLVPLNIGGILSRFEGDVFERFLDDLLNCIRGRDFKEKFSNAKRLLKRRVEKIERDIEKIRQDIPDPTYIEKLYLWGTALLSYGRMAERKGDSYVLPDPYTNEIIEIPIVGDLDPISLANYYFKEYSSRKKSYSIAKERLEEKEREKIYLEELLWELENVKNEEELKDLYDVLIKLGLVKDGSPNIHRAVKAEDTSKLYYSFDFGSFKVFVGRNAKGNDYVTFKLASKDDLWFHVKGYPGAHVVMRVKGDVDPSYIEKVAGIALYFSKARHSGKGEVDYTKVRNVRRLGGVPGRVIYTNYRSVKVKVFNPFEGG